MPSGKTAHGSFSCYRKNTTLSEFVYFLYEGDEVIVIQGKLDGIKTKYAEINSMSDNVLKKLEQVLSLSTKLHRNHEDLSSWLESVESETRAFADREPVGEQLLHAQSRQRVI